LDWIKIEAILQEAKVIKAVKGHLTSAIIRQ
jgi:hypothetical protein